MIRIITTICSLLITMPAFAASNLTEILTKSLTQNFNPARAIDWKPGDTANYNVDMGFIKGKMVTSVTSNDGNEIWLLQDMDLGFAGKQKVETLIDANTGEVKKVIANGQEQEIPKQDLEVVQIVDDTITVPAGTFKCIHATLLDKSSNDELNMWASTDVPMSGLVKQIAPSQFGQVTVELTSFAKQ
jgi:hypothetical protein